MEDSHSPSQSLERTPASSIHPSSPVASVFSRAHSSKSSTSTLSITSSPIPQDSHDLYGSRLGKVTEDPQEREESESYTLVDHERSMDAGSHFGGLQIDYNLDDNQSPPSILSGHPHFKRQRSYENTNALGHKRLSSRFNSLSRRWKNRSGAGPQLSIVTHLSPPASRAGSVSSPRIASPAVSSPSRHGSAVPPSPVDTSLDQSLHGSDRFSGSVDQPEPEQQEQSMATTPLLPPIFTELSRAESPIHSPLQSPSIAPTATGGGSKLATSTPPSSILPSPPLSTKPSVTSMRQRSRANTSAAVPLSEVPPLQMLDDPHDPWSVSLGHANFHIHPEPYLPQVFDAESYAEFRANWHQARTNYARHLARTIEHYGPTSKVFKLTEEKWNAINQQWKQCHETMTASFVPPKSAIVDGSATVGPSSMAMPILEKPITKVVLPVIDDKSGKFPELGDGEIVGPMDVAPPRSQTLPSRSPDRLSANRRRNLFKFLSDVFGMA